MASPHSRRLFLRNAAFAGAGVYLAEWTFGCKDQPKPHPAPHAVAPRTAPLSSAHRSFTDAEFLALTAAVDRVLPRDASPGGVDAGVPESIDRAFAEPALHRVRDAFIHGLAALERACHRAHRVSFAHATPAQRDALLERFSKMSPSTGEAHFFTTLLTFSLEGYLGDPIHGGNKDRVGWALVGFDPGPPFPMAH